MKTMAKTPEAAYIIDRHRLKMGVLNLEFLVAAYVHSTNLRGYRRLTSKGYEGRPCHETYTSLLRL